jgi:hypothetical protein
MMTRNSHRGCHFAPAKTTRAPTRCPLTRRRRTRAVPADILPRAAAPAQRPATPLPAGKIPGAAIPPAICRIIPDADRAPGSALPPARQRIIPGKSRPRLGAAMGAFGNDADNPVRAREECQNLRGFAVFSLEETDAGIVNKGHRGSFYARRIETGRVAVPPAVE